MSLTTMRIIKYILLLVCFILSFNCSVFKKMGLEGAAIIKEKKSTKELLNEPKRSRVAIILLDQEGGVPLKTDFQLLVNNIQFIPDSNKKLNLNLFSGQYIFQATGIGYDKRKFKLFVDEKYNYKISVKLSPNKTTFN